jgi:sugar lactone lactonase YvrE
MKRICFFAIALLFISSNLSYSQDHNPAKVKAIKSWSSEEVFLIPESVYYDKVEEVLYVSNIDGSPVVKDENGFISKVKTNGELLELRWVTGLHAPKGMGMHKGKLFVTDIDELVVIDIKKGEIINRYPAKDATFLNDITVDKAGTVYVSDMSGNIIYRYKNGEIEKWFEDEILQRPNGLFYLQGMLYIGCNDYILKLNPESKVYEVMVEGTGGIDGLNIDEEGNYIVSDWYGKVQYIKPDGQITILFDTSFETVNAADIFYEPSNHTLYVPTFRDGRVMAYEIVH